jgi:hypothetical protein
MNYTIWIVTPTPTYSHSSCFLEAAQSLRAAFIELGHECEITTAPPVTRENVVIMGAHLLHPADMLHLKNPIVWQLEQMPDGSDEARAKLPLTATYLEVLKRAHEVWDYSRVNQAQLGKLGIVSKLLEVGYSPCLTRIENVPELDIDVLFVGSMNERRSKILQALQTAGVKVVHAFDCYGIKRDNLIARAKIILNVHYYQAKVWEIVRCSYLLANRKCVVSETGLDMDLEKPYYGAIAFASYDGLADECLGILKDDSLRAGWEWAGFERMKSFLQVEFLRRAL